MRQILKIMCRAEDLWAYVHVRNVIQWLWSELKTWNCWQSVYEYRLWRIIWLSRI